jgi:hypothetical protein
MISNRFIVRIYATLGRDDGGSDRTIHHSSRYSEANR